MALTVSLWSRKEGEIKRFLERFYQKEINMDYDVDKWVYVYNKPLESIDIISAVMDNQDEFQIGVCIQIDNGDIHIVTSENHNDIIKGIFYLFYDETAPVG